MHENESASENRQFKTMCSDISVRRYCERCCCVHVS